MRHCAPVWILPFACKGGMCSTCRAKLVEGAAQMEVNYSLEPWELEKGFILTCQARPTTDRVVVDYDHGLAVAASFDTLGASSQD